MAENTKLLKYLLVFLPILILFNISSAQELSEWQYKIPITIKERSGKTLTDYQLLITIDTQSLISEGKMREDCGDIRFTDSDGTTLIPYWIESGCDSNNTMIWVKVPLIPAGGRKTIYMYYGNPQAENIGKMWSIPHLGIYNGVFDHDPFKMMYRIGVSTGYYHTCILKSNGNVYCYGDNFYGQAEDYLGGDAIAVSAGYSHTCILKSNGNADCYGRNDVGQSNDYLGGDAIAVLAASTDYTCILKSNGNVDCYGANVYGQANDYLGGDAIAVSPGGYSTCILKSNGNVYCYGETSWEYSGGDAVAVSASWSNICVLKSNGNVYCSNGEVYLGGDAIAVSGGYYHTCILKSNGNVDCFGNSYYGQANDYLGGDAIAVSSGGYHTCILKSNGNVECYGNNNYGQAEDYYGGDAYNPFRKYAYPEPTYVIGEEAEAGYLELPFGYYILVKAISPFVIGAGVLIGIFSLLFGISKPEDLIKIMIMISVLIVASIILVSML